MQTQRDHVHAHNFMMGRLSSALVEGDPTSARIPGQRALTGLLIGILLVVLIGGGFAVYGWIVPGGSTAYTKAGTILVEKETGNRYVYLKGTLYPTPNLTSAMLLEGDSATVKLISQASLKDLPRGPELGIADAPENVPAVADLVTGPWLACLPGSVVDDPTTDLGVSLDPRAVSAPIPAGGFELVHAQNGKKTYLLEDGKKYPVADDSVLVALGAANARVTVAPAAWLDWVPTGTTLGAAKIPGAGDPGPEVGGHSYPVGTLFKQQDQLFILRKDGLAAISRTELLLAAAKSGDAPKELDAADVVAAQRSDDRSLLTRLPDLTAWHWQDPGDQVLCVRQGPATESAVTSQVVLAGRATGGIGDDGKVYVMTKPGSGMTVTPVPATSNVVTPEVDLISDQGIAYRLADSDTVSALKLGSAAAVPFPRTLLALLPQGPELSRTAVTGLARG